LRGTELGGRGGFQGRPRVNWKGTRLFTKVRRAGHKKRVPLALREASGKFLRESPHDASPRDAQLDHPSELKMHILKGEGRRPCRVGGHGRSDNHDTKGDARHRPVTGLKKARRRG